MGGSRRVTLSDVATASGVSRATASFVLNDDPRQTISAATRERVLQAASDLGYVPHGIARALREGSSRIVVLNVEWGMEGNFSRSYVRGLDDELAAHGHVLLVRHGDAAPEAAQRVLDAITPRAVLRFGEPYRHGREPEGDLEHGFAWHAALQIRYLAERGHTHIAMALPDHEFPLTKARLRFARDAAGALGIPKLPSVVVPRPREAGTEAVGAFLNEHDTVTAVAAFDDDIALRTLSALRDLSLAVPGDIAVIGYDDTEYGALITPALTTVHIDAEARGRLAARTILGLPAAGLTMPPGHVIVRDSA